MQNDFSKGRVSGSIMKQAYPLLLAQLVHLLYNVVDRIYIGHIPNVGSMALTGIGLAFPITALTAAFSNLFGSGGMPLFAIARGAKEEEKADQILSQVLSMLLLTSFVLLLLAYLFRKPILYAFGASDASYPYADEYLRIYILGTSFAMITTGMNGFINAQGFPGIGMLTIVVGAVMNLILDPVFIFACGMGVSGAALATIISQAASALWILSFFFGKKSLHRIRRKYMKPELSLLKEITALGLSGFIMQGTNCLVQVVCNVMLRIYGGDLYVGIMTVVNSVREILALPANSITSGAQPVLSYNYGARKYTRVRSGIRFMAAAGGFLMMTAWILLLIFPREMMGIFTNDPEMIEAGEHALKLYFFGFVFMAFQGAGQTCFTSMKCPKRAIFFSLLRKAVIVTPLTLLLPAAGFGVDGVFAAEPISNFIGGLACFVTMYFTLYRKLPKEDL